MWLALIRAEGVNGSAWRVLNKASRKPGNIPQYVALGRAHVETQATQPALGEAAQVSVTQVFDNDSASWEARHGSSVLRLLSPPPGSVPDTVYCARVAKLREWKNRSSKLSDTLLYQTASHLIQSTKGTFARPAAPPSLQQISSHTSQRRPGRENETPTSQSAFRDVPSFINSIHIRTKRPPQSSEDQQDTPCALQLGH